jgi:type IV pilus assembly protein PilE
MLKVNKLKVNKLSKGFSLIELLIVIAILGIITAVAYPTYTSSLKTAYRADAMEELAALEMEVRQYYFEHTTYKGLAADGSDSGAPNETLLMKLDDGVKEHYAITITASDRHTFLLKATPKGGQVNEECGTISMGLNGNFIFSPPGGGSVPETCKQ